MRKILFFTSTVWALGVLHASLSKRLLAHGIHADVLDWRASYTQEEFQHLMRVYDYFLVTPDSLNILHSSEHYRVPLNRIFTIAHHTEDLVVAGKRMGGFDFLNEVAGLGAVNEDIAAEAASRLGITRAFKLVTNGVETAMFAGPPAISLNAIGHVGPHTLTWDNVEDCKRPGLLDEVLQGLPLVHKQQPRQHYMAMPSRYWDIDATLVTSSYESCGLPALETAAAGRLVVSTPTGYFRKHYQGLGALCSLEPKAFVQDARAILLHYKDSPQQYRERCQTAQEYCRQHFDWSVTLPTWLEVFA
jgi:hypothetical protein